jgi:SAM-dependent methyltransferase
LLEHAKFVDRYISEQNAQNVLELATGRGANSFWLAKENPNSNFFGIDLSEGQLSFALKATKKCSNFQAEIGDFHNLKQFKDNSFDIIFIVEALCHSNSTEKVLGEVQRILKDGGHFIVFDGYLGNKQLSNDEKVAAKITEHGMAVVEFLKYQDLKRMALNAGLAVIEEENLSQFVIPTMRRFERLAESFFKRPLIGRCVAWLFPQEFVYNSVSGMLMSVLFQERVFEYWVTVFKNKKAYPSE